MARKKKRTKKVVEEKKVVVVPKVHFNSWWRMRSSFIPARHSADIILADFKARGLSDMETVEDYDAALIKYGIML